MPGLYKFPRHERLTRRRDFLRVYDEGERWVGRDFVCYTVRHEGQGRRIGFTVSRKIGGAVVRNRIKRYLREIYRTHRPELADDVDVVVVARRGSAHLNYAQCQDAIRSLFRKGGLLRG